MNVKDFLYSLKGESGRSLHLMYKFNTQIGKVQQFSDKDP